MPPTPIGAVMVKTPSWEPGVRGMPVQYTGQRGAARPASRYDTCYLLLVEDQKVAHRKACVSKVSSHGGTEPRWKHDGSELYFRDGRLGVTNTPLMAVPMHADSRGGISAGVPVALFQYAAGSIVPQNNVWQYAPSPDGQRFLMVVPIETAALAIHVITNWLKATKDAGKQ